MRPKLFANVLRISSGLFLKRLQPTRTGLACSDIAEFLEINVMGVVAFIFADIDDRAIACTETVCFSWLDFIAFFRSNALCVRIYREFDLV